MRTDFTTREHIRDEEFFTFSLAEASRFTAAYVVQEGRDHGLPGYVKYREWCGLGGGKDFSDLRDISEEGIAKLQKIYKSVEDVDLVTGGLMEVHPVGSLLGPTFSCLLGEQLKRIRRSDRFWYENDFPPNQFSKAQLAELKKVTLASLLCMNTDRKHVQPQAFLLPDRHRNARVPCDTILQISLEPWKEAEAPELVIPPGFLDLSVERAKEDLRKRLDWEKLLFEEITSTSHFVSLDLVAPPNSAMGKSYRFHSPNDAAIHLANTSLVFEFVTQELTYLLLQSNNFNGRGPRQNFFGGQRQNFGGQRQNFFGGQRQNFGGQRQNFGGQRQNFFGGQQQQNFLEGQQLNNVFVGDRVPQQPPTFCGDEERQQCDPKSPFRTFSGWYISLPRQTSVTGQPLPSPRGVSTFIHADVSRLSNRHVLMIMQFGQFLDHDITMTPVHRGFQKSVLDCRACDSAQRVHPECFPIGVPGNDPFFPPVDVNTGRPRCINFVRSLPGQTKLGPRQQLNQNTAFLDASQVYGQNLCEARMLRAFVGGRLKSAAPQFRGKGLLPEAQACNSASGHCFLGGDNRLNEQLGLGALHTIFLREHNRIVDGLARANPHWDDERLFQNGRKILGAVFQHVTYNEFLPRVMGWNSVRLFDLGLLPEGYSTDYDPKCNPGALNEFGAAAFRFGHSLIRPQLHRMDQFFNSRQPSLQLREMFNNPARLLEVQMVDEITRGLLSDPMESLDQFVTKEVTNHLFEESSRPFSGLDLIATNIQRGRDHGLRPYNDYRQICNLKRATTFDDLAQEIPQEILDRYKQIYAHVDDIDLFTGGLCERPLEGGLVGPTLGCIIGLQFRSLKKCDRFWYENGDPAVRFTEAQLGEIRKATVAKIFCDNGDVVESIQRRAFDIADPFQNPRTSCAELPGLNLFAWAEGGAPVVEAPVVGAPVGGAPVGGAPAGGCTIGGKFVPVGQFGLASPCVQCTCQAGGMPQPERKLFIRIAVSAQLRIAPHHQLPAADFVPTARGRDERPGLPGPVRAAARG
ncbi:unnamed protein product [Darwinula stevensoni]|uniref:Peroxidase n=1 Tax=Darwinula stevensoni TaxID=69355 RepID=A0A7R9A3H8_9CRUS|nr:unnamed protein product [Darwinula stevensoni]CAG0881342.1 unnamed protein product [Darwinula stevensoni]